MSLILKYDLGNPHRLPQGYTPLAYIECTGTLLINTNIIMKNSIKIVSKWRDLSRTTSSSYHLLYSANAADEFTAYAAEQGFNWRWGGIAPNPKPVYKISEINYIELSSNGIRINGVSLGSYSGTPSFAGNKTIYLFGDGENNRYYLIGKCYFLRIWDNNILVRDFIPAKNSSGVVGLFDCVSQTFFTNQGTGEFIAGPEVVVLPYEYLLVECLKNIGSSYIVFNRELLANDILEVKASVLSRSGTQDTLVGGDTLLVFMNSNTAISYWKSDTIEAVTPNALTSITFNNRYNFKSKVKKTISSNYGIFAFSSGDYPIKSTIELVLITRNDQPIANIIPCYRRSDMKPGMYDTVNNVFYTNSGSGEFILGPVVEESSRLLEYNNAGSNYIGTPTNVHHSTSNPSTTQINCGSGEFDGTSSIIIADSPSENVRSASFWINADSLSSSEAQLVFVDYKSRLAFGRTSSGRYYISCGSVNTAYYLIDSLIGTNSWKHIVIINNGDSNTSTSRKLYVNGVLLSSSGESSYWGAVENKLNIGLRSLVENKGFDGKIYDFRLYDHALTADEVLQIYKKGV